MARRASRGSRRSRSISSSATCVCRNWPGLTLLPPPHPAGLSVDRGAAHDGVRVDVHGDAVTIRRMKDQPPWTTSRSPSTSTTSVTAVGLHRRSGCAWLRDEHARAPEAGAAVFAPRGPVPRRPAARASTRSRRSPTRTPPCCSLAKETAARARRSSRAHAARAQQPARPALVIGERPCACVVHRGGALRARAAARAFTGKRSAKRDGRFKAADGGTLLLDEIGGCLAVRDAGSCCARCRTARSSPWAPNEEGLKVDVRLSPRRRTAIRRPWWPRSRFREDLYVRAPGCSSLHLPTLRDRCRGDLALLVEQFLREFNPRRRDPHPLSPSAWANDQRVLVSWQRATRAAPRHPARVDPRPQQRRSTPRPPAARDAPSLCGKARRTASTAASTTRVLSRWRVSGEELILYARSAARADVGASAPPSCSVAFSRKSLSEGSSRKYGMRRAAAINGSGN